MAAKVNIWLILCLVFAAFADISHQVNCPENCDCSVIFTKNLVDCKNNHLSDIPYDLEDDVHILKASNNNLTALRRDTFRPLQLEELDLSRNGLKDVDPEAFNNLTELIILDLSDNFLESLDSDTFSSNSKLNALDLGGNPLQLLDSSNFLNSLSLKELDISSCQLIQLPDGTFANMKNIVRLSLDGNQIDRMDIQILEPLTNLQFIDLSDNPWTCNDCRQVQELSGWLRNRSVVVKLPVCGEPAPLAGMTYEDYEQKICTQAASQDSANLYFNDDDDDYTCTISTQYIVGFTVGIVMFFLSGISIWIMRRRRAKLYYTKTPSIDTVAIPYEDLVYKPLSKEIKKAHV